MRIDLYCGPSHESWSPKSIETGIGGSEEMSIYLMKELAELGHQVTVWNRCLDDEGEYDGVTYKNYDEFDVEETDILVVWRAPQLLVTHKLNKVKGKKYLWLHDTIPQLEVVPYLFAYDKIFVLSAWHKNFYIQLTTPELRDRYVVTRNAVNVDQFNQEIERDPYTIVYGSLYNRGLVELLSVWPKVKIEVPEAKLRIFYGWQTLEKMMSADEFSEFKKKLEYDMDQDGITHLERISHEQVVKEMLGAGIWAYPCINFNEVSCITAMKAQLGGAVPVVVPKAALNETVKYGNKIVTGRDAGHLLEKFTDELIRTLKDHKGQEAIRKVMMRNAPKQWGFKELAKEWQEVFND